MSIESWAVAKDSFRVAANGLPMPVPLRERRSNPRLVEIYEASIKSQIPGALKGYGISFKRADLIYLYTSYEASKGKETLVILSNDNDTESWNIAAKAISMLFVLSGTDIIAGPVEVEIWN